LFQVLSKKVPGLFVTERSVAGYGISTGASGGLSIRGMGASSSRVLMLIDGHPQFMGLFGHPVADAYMAQDVERVEVVRGPASVLYGSGAMGGAVNMITRKLNQDGMHSRFTAMAGSYNTQKLRAQNEIRKGRFSSFLSLSHDRSEGHRDRLDYRNTAGMAKLGYALSDFWTVTADASLSGFVSEYPGPVMAPVEDSRGDIMRLTSSLTARNDFGHTGGAATLFYNYGDHEIQDGHAPGAPDQPLYRSTDDMFGVNIYQWYRFRTGTTVTLGLDGRHYGGSARKGGNVFADDRQAEEYAAYSQVRQSLFGALTMEAGLRVERSSRFGTEVIPQGGAVYRLTENHTIRASVSKGYRSPNIRELYMFPPANDQLQPESMLNYEAGMSHRLFQGKLTAQWGLFYSEGDNLIQTVTPPVVVRPQNLNVGQFRHKGVEASLRWTPVDDALFTAGYSYLWMERPMGFTPRHQLSLGGSYALGAFRLDADFQFIGDLYTEAVPSATPLRETYGVLDARLGYRPRRNLEIFVKGDNLLDGRYETMSGFPMPGITGLFGVTLDL